MLIGLGFLLGFYVCFFLFLGGMFRVSSQNVPLGCAPWPTGKMLSMNPDLLQGPGLAGELQRERNGNTLKNTV